MANRVFICAGEPSGDEFASLIVKEYRDKYPTLEFVGVGSNSAARAGVNILMGYEFMTVFGVQSFIRSVFQGIDVYRRIARLIYKERPGLFIGVAYPGINLLLCRYARKLGCRTFLFMPPQIWAWGNFRKFFIRKWVNKVITVFPFEYEYYKEKKIAVEYIVHPLLKELKNYKRCDNKKRIGFMPGSRHDQLARHMPVMEILMEKIHSQDQSYEFCLILHPDAVLNIQTRANKIINKNRYQTMKNCDIIITTSGTASLEAEFLSVPQVFFHIPSFIDMHFFRYFLSIREYNLANLYYGRKIVPAIISRDQNKILGTVLNVFDNILVTKGKTGTACQKC